MSAMQDAQSDSHLESVETEYEKYCCAREIFVNLKPNWLGIIVVASIAMALIIYALTIVVTDILLALMCIAGGLAFLICIVLFEYWRMHRRMDALAEMRLRGKTFNF